MIHSGSRKLGANICDTYNNVANKLCERWYHNKQIKDQLAFLPLDSDEGVEYLSAMNFALYYAKQNRAVMMHRVVNIFFNLISKYVGQIQKEILSEEDVHHNYAALENHFGKNVVVHRKGAIRAREKDIVIIPGSVGSPSYIGVGKGNTDSFHSCSHGAGRSMGRKAANKNIDPNVAEKSIADVIHMPFNGDYGEAKEAYKDISEVITNQKDLIKTTMELRPLVNIKDNTNKTRKK
jgi:tRNA-splicing ligase RtcB